MRSLEPLAPETLDDPLASGRLRLELATPLRSLVRCRVCGFSEVHTDEVVHRGPLILAECPRCEHRWTRPAGETPLALGPRPGPVRARPHLGEAAAAA